MAQSPDTQWSKLSELDTCSSRAIFFSCPPTSRLRPRLLLVRVVHQRVVRVVHQRVVRVVHQRVVRVGGPNVVRVGGPNVTAACLYPALRLDKLYAALIRCLVLWTVTKQFLVSYFKGLYLLTGGSDVTRGISCDSSVH